MYCAIDNCSHEGDSVCVKIFSIYFFHFKWSIKNFVQCVFIIYIPSPTSPRSTHLPYPSSIRSNLCYPHTLGGMNFSWSVVGLLGATNLKKKPNPSSPTYLNCQNLLIDHYAHRLVYLLTFIKEAIWFSIDDD